MFFNVKIVTTANRTLKFQQPDQGAIEPILASLRMAGQLFSHRSMVISTGSEIQLISPSSLTRIEIETGIDLSGSIPQLHDTPLTLIGEGAATPEPVLTETEISTRIDCFFEGGDTISVWISGPRPASSADRMMRLSRFFENPVLIYKLPQGGVGFMNTARLIRIRLDAVSDLLPATAWRLNPLS
jgi:hypothetical protein